MTTDGQRIRLVADIGGTYARIAVQRPGTRPEVPVVVRCADHADIEAAVRAALAEAGADPPPRHAAIAVAAPVLGDVVELTNHPWRFSCRELRQALRLDRLIVINDFAAIALALPRLKTDERRKLGAGEAVPRAPVAVLGPGTGLGVAGLVRVGRRWVPFVGEGGHADFAPVEAREIAVFERLRRRFDHVSLERILSGPGLVNLYRALGELSEASPAREAGLPTAAQITARARAGDSPLCRETIEVFCDVLAATAGNVALTLGARGGVYIAGGIVPKLGPLIDEGRFRRRFEAKGRLGGYLAPIPTYLVAAAEPALVGLAALLDDVVRETA